MKSEIINILKKCYDPEIPIDLWNLGLIYSIDFTDENINDLKAQLAMNTFNEMINFDQDELRGSINDLSLIHI